MSSIRLTDSSTLTDDATARQLAVDPSTPPAELERLLGRGAEIDRALVRHPNVPLRVYRTLAPAYPRSACANPAIGRLIEEEPGLIRAIPRLCEQPLCPPSQLGWVARHGRRGQQLAVLRNPAVPDDVRASLTPAHFHNDALRRLESLALAQPRGQAAKLLKSGTFADGIASGDPTTKSIVLWTRLDGASGTGQVELEVATDKAFRKVVARSKITTNEKVNHAVKAQVNDPRTQETISQVSNAARTVNSSVGSVSEWLKSDAAKYTGLGVAGLGLAYLLSKAVSYTHLTLPTTYSV